MNWTIETSYILNQDEKQQFEALLRGVKPSPYKHYPAFREAISAVVEQVAESDFAKYLLSIRDADKAVEPTVLLKNVPRDSEVPVLGNESPVHMKYQLKDTFVAEGFLELISQLMQTPPIGYINVNFGDVFQDIYPIRDLSGTQSQKSNQEIYFHKDLANHFVRPDCVYMYSMYNNPVNEVYTSFVRNIDIRNLLSEKELEMLAEPVFYTPFDDLTVHESRTELDIAELHPVLSGEDVRYFENRTTAVDPEYSDVLKRFNDLLHELKVRVFLEPGEVLLTFNNHVTHAKEIVDIVDEAENWKRWIMKTVNVFDLSEHGQHMLPGTDYLVNG